MYRKISVLFVLLLLLLAACSSKTLIFSGETDNWSANLKVIQTSDYETQEFVLKYKGNDVNSVEKITYSVDSVGGFGRSGATLAENGTLKDSSEANPTNAKVSEHTEVEVTVEWNGNIEKIKLSK